MLSRDNIMHDAMLAHRTGRRFEAEENYKKLVVHDPADVGALNLLGVISYQDGLPSVAARLTGRAVRINPNSADCHSNFALAKIELDSPDDALRHIRRAIVLRPDFAEAVVGLSAALHELGRADEAEAVARRAILMNPSAVSAWNNLGLTLRRLDRHTEAIPVLLKAIVLAPSHAKATHNLGLILMEIGASGAKTALTRSLRLNPGQVHYFRSFSLLHRFHRTDEWLDHLERIALTLPSLSQDGQIEAHFVLAKAYGDIGENDQAFEHLLMANALKRERIHYDEPATLGLFQRISATFDARLIRELSGQGEASEMPIFIVGMPRSGTSLVEQVLASHSEVSAAGELDDFGRLLEGLTRSEGCDFPELTRTLDPLKFRALGRDYLDIIKGKAVGARFVTDKMPGNLAFAGMIHLALPNARIIMVERDPIDTCLSCFSTHFTESLGFAYDLAELGRFAHACDRLRTHWRTVLPKDRVLTVRYENVVQNLEVEARRLVEFCGLAWEPACLEFHRTDRAVKTASITQVRQPIYTSSIRRWRPNSRIVAPLLSGLQGG